MERVSHVLGLDIGSNSVGSAWIDFERKDIRVGVSVFPAGVNEKSDDARGEPKNVERRQKRSLRRSIARRSARKRRLRKYLISIGLLPSDPIEFKTLAESDAWSLRFKGMDEVLSPHEFGRILLHLCQRRGASGLRFRDETEDDKGKRKGRKMMIETAW